MPTPSTASAAAADLVGDVDLVVDGGPLAGTASTVIDATRDPWTALRSGHVDPDEVIAVAASAEPDHTSER